jgi:hypothetical protein
MKLRHAAALVGWYLMLPPYKAGVGADLNAPFAAWIAKDEYRSEMNCKAALRKYQDGLPERLRESADNRQAVEWLSQAYPAARCLWTTYPRLKPN